MRYLPLLFLLFFQLAAATGSAPPAVLNELRRNGIPIEAVAIDVRAADGGKPLLAVNHARAFKPASVMKLLTTQAALELLGPDYRWITRVYAHGVMEADALRGDLVIEGSGDPRFAHEDLWRLMTRLRALGLREIRGNLVLDRRLFRNEPQDPAAFDGRPERAYNASPDALLLDAKALTLLLQPRAVGQTAQVASEPVLSGFTIEPPITIDGPCNVLRDQLQPKFGAQGLRFSGGIPASCGERELSFHLYTLDHRQYFGAVFRALWSQLGGSLSGSVIDGELRSDARELTQWVSAPLASQLRDINKFSNNVMARNLLLSLAARRGDVPASSSAAVIRVVEWMKTAGLDSTTLVLQNGSGLAREEKLSASVLAALLQRAWQQPTMPEFVASLPVAGIDGTMAKRFDSSPLKGRAHIKTGSLDDVASIAGYVTARSGKRIAVVAMINHPKANEARAAFDQLLLWVFERY
ncbi:MAG: D-alanyl-D-alanine carboxypeptidase/D-alanyl-D-alanine-endopeptidase [Burkholderiaceae bacterium]|nr:D-alanyl-D-alanine carboxypeptidase/D-alanyl-D-alanine-endopeptidase [Burkholderiaceae bacterium]